MSELRTTAAEPPTVALFATELKPQLPIIAKQVALSISSAIPPYAHDRAAPRLHNAVAGALTAFTESLVGPSATGPKVDDHFRRLGYTETTREPHLGDLFHAVYIGLRETWSELRSAALGFELQAEALAHVGHAVFAFTDHLAEQIRQGQTAARTRTEHGMDPRSRLLAALAIGDETSASSLAASAKWPLPDRFIVIAAAGVKPGSVHKPPDAVLVNVDSGLAICAPEHAELALSHLTSATSPQPIAVTWSVQLSEIPQAIRWADRVLTLTANGVIEPEPVLHCEDHRTEIWLHAEPALRQRLSQDLLQPLLAETPNSREILSETLLAWLETRESAPAIAAQLGVHAQTVRYRWKRINNLFGENLHDPAFVVQMTMLLKASLPLWKAGDQSDFERFEAASTSAGESDE